MDFPFCLSQLEQNSEAIRQLVAGVTPEQARWKPDADSWSILEVINHLADEEREDFRPRVKISLSGSGEPFPPNDPPRNVIERHYNERDWAASVADFVQERKASLEWLNGLHAPIWTIPVTQKPFNEYNMVSGHFMVSWAAHDVLHLRQLVELKWAYQQMRFEGLSTLYAGEW